MHTFPLRLRQLSETLLFAAISAENAGFLDFPDNADYKHRNDWVPTPFWGQNIFKGMHSLSDILNIGRFVNETSHDEETVGNLAWFQDNKTFYCRIIGVLDLISEDKLYDVDSDEHQEFLQDFGSLSLFPVRLRELAQHLEDAATASIKMNFLTIPDTEDDASSGGSDGDEGDEDEED